MAAAEQQLRPLQPRSACRAPAGQQLVKGSLCLGGRGLGAVRQWRLPFLSHCLLHHMQPRSVAQPETCWQVRHVRLVDHATPMSI
jgi:hypothetical protein